MTNVNATFCDWSEGEISYKMRGRSDIGVFKSVAEWLQNFIVLPQGSITFRPGTSYVHHTRLHQQAVLFPFYFNDIQAFLVEFTQGYARFYTQSGIITEPGIAITGITQANPGVVTAPAHGYTNGQEVFIYDTVGMEQLTGQSFIVTGQTTDTFELYDEFGNPWNTTQNNPYVSGGESFLIYEIESPYQLADLSPCTISYAQSTSELYLCSRNYAPYKLIYTSDTNWSLSTFTRTADPFGANNWPGAVAFTSDGRLIYGGTNDNPTQLWGSAGPTNSGSRYDDFTLPSNPTNIDAYTYTLAVIHGEADSIRWISNTDQFLVIGCFGSCRYGYGSAVDEPITSLAVNIRSVNAYGCSFIPAVPLGPQMFYAQRSASVIRCIEYDYLINGYESNDKNLISDHIIQPGLVTLCNQTGIPDILWCCRNDGTLAGMTYNVKENKYGWHRHIIGGDAKIEWVQKLPQQNNQDVLWMIANRTDNMGRTVRHVEFISPYMVWPDPLQFYTGVETQDNLTYSNVLYEAQKNGIFLDASAVYDGSAKGLSENITMMPGIGATQGGAINVSFTTSTDFFTASMVGEQIWGGYDSSGVGGGRALITSLDSTNPATVAYCTILDNGFPSTSIIVPGNWYLTTKTFYGLHYLEGKEVTICNDGALYGTSTVKNATVTIAKPASKAVIGLPYTGLIRSVGIDEGAKQGPAMTKIKTVYEARIKFYNSCGTSFGTDPYKLEEMQFRQTGQITGRPIPLYTGILRVNYTQDTPEQDKHIYIIQNQPFSCIINSIDTFVKQSEA